MCMYVSVCIVYICIYTFIYAFIYRGTSPPISPCRKSLLGPEQSGRASCEPRLPTHLRPCCKPCPAFLFSAAPAVIYDLQRGSHGCHSEEPCASGSQTEGGCVAHPGPLASCVVVCQGPIGSCALGCRVSLVPEVCFGVQGTCSASGVLGVQGTPSTPGMCWGAGFPGCAGGCRLPLVPRLCFVVQVTPGAPGVLWSTEYP